MVAVTMVFTGNQCSFSLKGSGTITINWGGGSEKKTETAVLSLTSSKSFANSYSQLGTYTITITVPTNGMVASLSCFDNSLTSLNVDGNSALEELLCYNNKLSILNVSGLNKLQTLDCRINNLNAQALDNLFKTLNSASDIGSKTLHILDNPGVSGCTVKTALDKGWTVDSASPIRSILGTTLNSTISKLNVPIAPVLDKLSDTPTAVTGVTLDKTVLTLTEGGSETLTASVTPSTATNKSVTWNSNNLATATVDANGKIVAVKKGDAIVTVTTKDGNKTVACNVTVKYPPATVTGIELNTNTLTLAPGGSAILSATVISSDDEADKKVTWNSSNPSDVQVNSSGVVEVSSTATIGNIIHITASTSNKDVSAKCAITVGKNDQQQQADDTQQDDGAQQMKVKLMQSPITMSGDVAMALSTTEELNDKIDIAPLVKAIKNGDLLFVEEDTTQKALIAAIKADELTFEADTTKNRLLNALKAGELTVVESPNVAHSLIDGTLHNLVMPISPKFPRTRTINHLLRIKWISEDDCKKLSTYDIFDVPGLLVKGKTQGQRNGLATALGKDVAIVNSWVKQADLWRVDEMTPSTACLLVQIGVRHVEDLAKVDPEIAYPFLQKFGAFQSSLLPDLVDKTKFERIVEHAGDLTGFSINQNKFDELILKLVDEKLQIEQLAKKNEEDNSTVPVTQTQDVQLLKSSVNYVIANKMLPIQLIKRLEVGEPFSYLSKDEIKAILVQSKNYFALGIETDEEEPTFLFRNDIVVKSSGKIIREGLDFLKNVELALPLPHAISGTVYVRKQGEKDADKVCFSDVLVEIDGITSPSSSKDEAGTKCSGFADSTGYFCVVMPDSYNLQESIVLTISQGAYKQKFIKQASSILNSVKEQEILNLYDQLDAISRYKEIEQSKLDEITRLDLALSLNSDITPYSQADIVTMTRDLTALKGQEEEIITRRDSLQDQFDEIVKQIKAFDKTSNDLEKILTNILYSKKLEAELGDFVLIEEIFKGYRTDLKRVLPSVKLMGNDDEAIHLPTDTAPSKVHNYSMLQRLVEPEISPPATSSKARQTMKKPVDVAAFKELLYKDPDKHPQMSSLGLGYILNMHQAWCPDGFALGTLLYSLVLAPGEEQRLIVREKTQSYSVLDNLSGSESVSENYALSQTDDTSAVFNYAISELLSGSSNYDDSTRAKTEGGGFGVGGGIGGIVDGICGMFGLSGNYSKGTSKTSGSGSASSRQSNTHNEASNAAQTFQHSIKSAANKFSQVNRINMRMATSEERDSVATKIIANHNHSHAMTIQYWEVLRRYRLETCIDSVDLVLFVPLRIIRFLPKGQDYALQPFTTFDKNKFYARYEMLLKYADTLSPALPSTYRTGLNLIKKYAAYPNWTFQSSETHQRRLTLTFDCTLLPFDDITASLVIKNTTTQSPFGLFSSSTSSAKTIAGNITYTPKKLSKMYTTSLELRQGIRKTRDDKNAACTVTCTFDLPSSITPDDLSYIKINHSCEQLEYSLYQNTATLTAAEKAAYDNWLGRKYGLAMDNIASDEDRAFIAHYESQLPEAFRTPVIYLSSQQILDEGAPTISNVNLSSSVKTDELDEMLSSSSLRSSVTISIVSAAPVLKRSELQHMESLMHYVASRALYFSQRIWAALSADERAMLLEQYTINMDFDSLTDADAETGDIDIPLLNCVNVRKSLGFYGNCILLPFTYPQKLAEKLGKTAAELQDSLYRYHTCHFRVPTTVISLPTDGMIGEAVLGETNVSELIDITRFWNWKDSPIDKMTPDNTYLNNADYLEGKAPGDISALNLQGATAPVAEKMVDLISTLVAKQTPAFNNITGLDQLKDVLNEGTKSAAAGRKELLEHNVALSQSALEYAKGALDASKDLAIKDKDVEVQKAKDSKEMEAQNKLKEKELELKEKELDLAIANADVTSKKLDVALTGLVDEKIKNELLKGIQPEEPKKEETAKK